MEMLVKHDGEKNLPAFKEGTKSPGCFKIEQSECFDGDKLAIIGKFVEGACDHLQTDRNIPGCFHQVKPDIAFFIDRRGTFQAFENLHRNPLIICQ
jgi:hypothetical protein